MEDEFIINFDPHVGDGLPSKEDVLKAIPEEEL